jgi:hypothetical protein
MPLSTYSELQTAIQDECIRPDWTAAILQDLITRAEGKLNRRLKSDSISASLTGVVDSRYISTSALTVLTPQTLWITVDGEEERLTPNTLAGIAHNPDTMEPTEWAFDKDNDQIVFNTLLDRAYPIRFVYVQKFKLSDAVTTNWLLDNYPDIYLDAAVAEGWRYMRDLAAAADYDRRVSQSISEIQSVLADHKRSTLKTDIGLSSIGTSNGYGYRFNRM